ncbi:hypothetical protein DEO72_LG8g1280 [Vigna unguiculata]|uniref:Uncharacterized protein n=1 Tax=Vigna unguiculata TaxID=3917 RepID=A0A4D6MPA3_VIGUN|nr:hypothetical protein DEO72_LG8g1280 [Vigna unguiculata]
MSVPPNDASSLTQFSRFCHELPGGKMEPPGTKTWGFYQVLMYRLVAPCLPLGADWYKGKFRILNWLVVKEIYMNGLE